MVYRWSKTAANNASADPTINWAEGQPPSSINDSSRAEMARVAQYRDDISGALLTTGTGAVYSISSNQVFDTLANMNGAMVAFTPHTTNTGAATINVDSLGAKPIRSVPGLDIPSNTLIQGTPYVITYSNVDGVWYLRGVNNPYSIPLGAGMDYWGTTAPNSAFAFPVGQNVSRTTYAALFNVIGTTYGSGDGSTTFTLPNKVGAVSAMRDPVGLRISGATFNSTDLGGFGGLERVTLTTSQLPTFTPTGTVNIDHNHIVPLAQAQFQIGASSGTTLYGPGLNATSVVSQGVISPTKTLVMDQLGGNQAHTNVQPTIICNYIMRII